MSNSPTVEEVKAVIRQLNWKQIITLFSDWMVTQVALREVIAEEAQK